MDAVDFCTYRIWAHFLSDIIHEISYLYSKYKCLFCSRPKNPDYSKPPTSKPELKVASRFPADLMEQFPCLNADRQIRLAALHKRVSVASVFDISEHFPQPPTRPYKTDRRTLHKVVFWLLNAGRYYEIEQWSQ